MKTNKEESSKLKINYQLKNEKSQLKPIIGYINFGQKEIDLLTRKVTYKRIIFSTGIKILPADWDSELKMPIKTDDRNQIQEINRNIRIVYDKLLKKGAIDFYEFKEEIEERILGKEKKEAIVKVRLVDFIRENIVASNTIKKTSKSPYKNLIGKLEEYEKQIGKVIYSKDVNEEMYLDFIEFYRPYAERINAVWAIQKVFKAVLKEIARFYKIKVFDPATELSNRDKIQAENADAVYLNMEQIQMIIDFDPEEDRLYNAKYIFMILLFTGCRESDVYKIIPEAHHSVKGISFNYCRYITQKTETEIICPILKPLQDMFDENKGKPPRKIAQQKLNLYVKELAFKSGLDQEVSTTYTDSTGKKKKITKKLHEFISSHTGRRSFITNLINFIPLPTLTKITGHKLQDKSIIFAYNKMTLLENAVMFCNQLRRATEENPEYFPFSLVD
jgi:integrase